MTFNVVVIAILAFASTINCDDTTPIPGDRAQVAAWFSANVQPLEARKGTLDPSLVEAEANPKVIKLRQDGSGDFKTLAEAVKSIPEGNKQRVFIVVGPGNYVEKVTIEKNKPFITLIGETSGADVPSFSFNGDAKTYGTVYSATIQIESDFFVCANLIIKNTSPPPDGKRDGAQAAALRIGGDKAAFYNTRFEGFQDTLCDDKGQHFFMDCYVEGTIDFIFGNGRSIYLNTEISAAESFNKIHVIVAHAKKDKTEETGYSFVNCKITGTSDNCLLGRAWFESPEVVFAYTEMPDIINPVGWSNNGFPERDATIFFGEYKNTGPGADTKQRVPFTKQLTDAEAQKFITLGYIQGSSWLLPPPTVPGGGAPAKPTQTDSKTEL